MIELARCINPGSTSLHLNRVGLGALHTISASVIEDVETLRSVNDKEIRIKDSKEGLICRRCRLIVTADVPGSVCHSWSLV